MSVGYQWTTTGGVNGTTYRNVNTSGINIGTFSGAAAPRGFQSNYLSTRSLVAPAQTPTFVLVAVEEGGPVSETPTPGGATAGGFGPVAVTSTAAGGALAQGTAPAPRTAVPVGGALAQGVAPTARAVTPQGGALAQGTGPAPARVTFAPGGATAGGFAPTESTPGGENVPPGGAVAGGIGPAAISTVTVGGALALGNPATVRVALSPGGAIAGGQLTDPIAAALPVSGSVTVSDFEEILLAVVDSSGAAVSVSDVTDGGVTISNGTGAEVAVGDAVGDAVGASVTFSDVEP